MADITAKMKDGAVREFTHEGRPSRSYTKSVKQEASFIIEDEWGKHTIIPAQDVAEVVKRPHRGW